MDFHLDGPPKTRLVAFKTPAQPPVQFRVACFPKFVTDVDAREIKVVPTKAQFGNVGHWTSDFIHPPALFLCVGPAGIEPHSVARLQRPFQPHEHVVAAHAADFAEINAAFLPEAPVNEFLVVDAAQPAGVKAARKGHLHSITVVAADAKRLIIVFWK